MRTFKKLFKKNNLLVFVFVFILFGLVFFMYKKNYEGFAQIFVRNLPINYTSGELQNFFSRHGAVTSAKVMKSRESANGIVEVSDNESHAMVQALNGKMIGGRSIAVALSVQKKPTTPAAKSGAKKPLVVGGGSLY